MEQYAISTHGLTKIFGRGFCALNNVCLNIRKGDIYGLVGRNGAGKTTLLRIVAGLSAADNGYVSINGATTYEENEIQRRRVGCIIEGPALYGGLTAWQNMEARALLVNADKDKINEALSLSGLEYFQGKKVKDFSLGMKQRLALALALLNEPEILLLDEPVNGLDPVGINDIRELLKKINEQKGTTIVVSSHYLGELEKLVKTFGILEQGRLIRELSAEQFTQAAASCVRIVVENSLTDALKAVETFKKAGVEVTSVQNDVIFAKGEESDIPVYNRLLVENGIGIRKIDCLREDFESYFLRLMRGENK